jgi:hypothetical protein
MPDRSRGRSQMKRDTLGVRLTTSHRKNKIVQKPDSQPQMDGLNRSTSAKEQEYPHKRIHLGTWFEDVYDDLRKMKVEGWGGKMKNREEWRLEGKEGIFWCQSSFYVNVITAYSLSCAWKMVGFSGSFEFLSAPGSMKF